MGGGFLEFKKFLFLMSFLFILILFMGSVSATDYTLSEVENASTGVQSYIASHGNVPGFVDISSKNSTDQSFLYTMTRTTVKLDAGTTTSTSIVGVGEPTGPSGSATGTIYKAEYVSIASNINSFVSSNGRAPNYASSSKGNIRYESLVYMYANIIDFYRDNNRLPNYVTVTYVAGIDSTGVTIDNIAPSVSNNLASGTYNTTKTVTLTATDHVDPNPKVYYSTNGGSTWSYQTKTVTLTLNPGVTTLKYYGKDAAGNVGATQTATYTITDTTAPTVTANLVSSTNSTYPYVILTATDNIDPYPAIYYTTNGTDPTTSSTRYISPINITSTDSTILKFMARDAAGNQASVQTQCYSLNLVSDIISGKSYSRIQDAINDPLTLNTHILEVQSGTYIENIVINKQLIIRPADGSATIRAANPSNPVITINSAGSGSTIEGFTIIGATSSDGIYLNSANNCSILNNIVTSNNDGIYLLGSSNSTLNGNTLTNNAWYGAILYDSDYNTISGNSIKNNDVHGMYISNSCYNTIHNNVVTNNTGDGICLDASNNLITENTITNNQNGISLDLSGSTRITDNAIIGNAFDGVYLYHSPNCVLTENTIMNNGGDGICFFESAATFTFNVISGNGAYGLYGFFEHYNPSAVNATNNWWGTNSPKTTAGTPGDIYIEGGTFIYTPWFSKTIEFTKDQIKTAAGTIKTYIETNRQLPSSVTISGISISMPQFLKLATTAVINIVSNTDGPIVLGNATNAPNPRENITNGIIDDIEYLDIAKQVKLFMDTNGYAPNYIANISLGDSIRFESLVYMYSQLMNSYDSTNGTLPDGITVTPWIAVLNPNGTYNFGTQKVFNTIQAAIDDADTQNGDTITLGNKTFTENVIVNKQLTICSLSGNTTVNATNQNLPVFTIGTNGSSSIIQGLTISGASNTDGIFLNSTNNCTITGNTVTNNWVGIHIGNSNNTTISENIVINNGYYGIYQYNSNNSTISENTIKNQTTGTGVLISDSSDSEISENNVTNNAAYGIYIYHSNNTIISGNDVTNNIGDGVYRFGHGIYIIDASANVNFNRIFGNSGYELYNGYGMYNAAGIVNATNNWWGSNNNPSSKILNNGTGSVTYDPWLVLNVTSSRDYSNRTGSTYNQIITADLTHNSHGEDTTPKSSDDNIQYDPYEIPLYFNTTLGTIETSTITVRGKTTSKLSSTTPGIANVTATVDNQTILLSVNVTSINVLGVYNTRTGQGFETIQAAINDANTQNGDTIILADGTYTENIIVDKGITLTPVSGVHVVLTPLDGSNPVIKITSSGNNSTIRGLRINEGTYGIYIWNLSTIVT